MKSIICDYSFDNLNINLISPIIGRISLDLQSSMLVSPSQKIGIIKRNDEVFILETTKDLVVCKLDSISSKKEIFVQCNEVFLSLKAYEQNVVTNQETIVKDDDYIYAAMDGLIYLRSSPLEEYFVNVGDIIKPGQTIALVEVMKNFYSLTYDKSSPMKVSKILIKDASSISYGQVLMALEKF